MPALPLPTSRSHRRTAAASIVALLLVVTSLAVGRGPDGPVAPELRNLGIAHAVPLAPDGWTHLVVQADAAAADRLRADPSTASVTDIGGGYVAVRTHLDAAAIQQLSGSTPEPDPPAAISATGVTDPYVTGQWAIENTGQAVRGMSGVRDVDTDEPAAYTAGVDGRGVTVALIDTGVDFDHPDLRSSSWTNPHEICGNGVDDDHNGYVDDCRGWDFANNDNNPDDPGSHWHGTHVASVIAASIDDGGMAGLAPGAKIMALKVSDTGSFDMSKAVAAIRYAVDNGAQVINASWGSSGSSSALAAAVSYAEAHRVLMVVAAGNDGANVESSPIYPAALPNSNILTVANGTSTDALAPSSNYGTTSVDLVAPGTDIIGAIPEGQWAYATGTSMATPQVAAAAALLIGHAGGSLAPAQTRSRLLATADREPAYVGKVVSGGRMNIAAALGLPDPDGNTPTPTTTTPTIPVAQDTAVDFDGFSALTTSVALAGTVRFAPHQVPTPDRYRLEGQLLSIEGGTPSVVQGLPMWVGDQQVATDDAGTVTLVADSAASDLSSGSTVTIGAALAAGRYAFVVSAVDSVDALQLLDAPSAVVFDVADDTTAPPAQLPPSPPASDPGSSVPGTTIPTITPPSGGGGSTGPGSGAPGSGGPGSTSPGSGTPGSGGSGGSSTPTTAPSATAPRSPSAGSGSTPRTTVPPSSGGSGPSGPSGSAPTTAAPAPGGSGRTTPTTPAPAPSTPGQGPATPSPAPVSSGPWRIDSVSPRSCAVGGACRVRLSGPFPATPSVWFGNLVVPATDVQWTSTSLIVAFTAAVNPGTVDVSIRRFDVSLAQPGGFTFTAAGGSGGSAPSSPGGGGSAPSAPTTPTTPTPSPTPTTAPSGTATTIHPTTAAPTTTVPPAMTPTTTTPPGPNRRRTPVGVGTSRQTASGLRVAPIVSGNPLASVPSLDGALCRSGSCPGLKLA